jgi:hypothetical protein
MVEGGSGEGRSDDARQDADRVRVSPDAVARRVGDQVVLVHLRTNRIYELNRTGARLWELLQGGADLQQANQRMLAEFDVNEEELRNNMNEIVNELVAMRLLERDASG